MRSTRQLTDGDGAEAIVYRQIRNAFHRREIARLLIIADAFCKVGEQLLRGILTTFDTE